MSWTTTEAASGRWQVVGEGEGDGLDTNCPGARVQ